MPDPSELFRSTAPYYAAYRPGYPADMFDRLAATFALGPADEALDLGCGTGQIATPLAGFVGHVLAVDPEPTMLEQGRQQADEQHRRNITWAGGDSYRLCDLALPRLSLVTIGAAFHWMERDAVLRELDHYVVPDGAVVLASGGPPGMQVAPEWADTVAGVRQAFLGPSRRAGSSTYRHPVEDHREILQRSPFTNVEVWSWTWDLVRDLDSLVGLQFSYSFSSPAQFSCERSRMEFESELRRTLIDRFPTGVFTETIYTEALVATRP